MNRQFLEFRGKVTVLPKEVTTKEAWLIVYNKQKENIIHLAKMWSCHNDLGCRYDDEIMKELDSLVIPTVQASSSDQL